ncbi:class I lanthipeptide [Lacinutrix sp. Hel_I_90]|uniref:class I lanthipeptide n=1 Tax=Lacinutrix sp. Hel_I_90 TaxID=1249999 RepID=UPI0005C8DB09|nr:class I lanthipeptide [Lacinutrix sp. Hel_I_90]
MKTQANKKLVFKKNNIVELNDSDIFKINGGTGSVTDSGIDDGNGTGGGDSVPPDILGTRNICLSVNIIAGLG